MDVVVVIPQGKHSYCLANLASSSSSPRNVLQEIIWIGEGQMKINEFIIYFKGTDKRHHFGTGFAVHKNYESCVSEFNSIFERICTIRLRTKLKEICLINIHAPTKNSDERDKDEFYDEVTRISDRLPGSVIKIVLGDINAKIWKELMFVPTIGLESVYEGSNDNGQRIISFAASINLVVSSTT
ncbi:craniofacial development protein 2-like [Melanaphis sacchari]|uniref:craniofacial development protein 2-like n=1 Tax=Melanaphis sacchari TaxID=742174 RepID=UPI000DC130A4|nr:craniofacial development protein 2-like [Melanaphis sacchari]